MKIEYRTGDLFLDKDANHVIHCCNNKGRARSGFAGAVRLHYPKAFEDYERKFESIGLTLGEIIVHEADNRTLYHMIGQDNYGYDGKKYASYDAIALGFMTMDQLAATGLFDKLYMPALGAVLAGGRWSIIEAIIEEHSKHYQPIVYLLDGKKPE